MLQLYRVVQAVEGQPIPAQFIFPSTERQDVLEKTLTSKALDGTEITQKYYFNVSKRLAMKIGVTGWLQELMDKYGAIKSADDVRDPKDRVELLEFFEKIIRISYGIRHEDNVQFIQNEEVSDAFVNSDAFEVLYWELFTNPESMAEFFNKVFPDPAEMTALIEAAQAAEAARPAATDEDAPAWVKEDRDPTPQELQGASKEHLVLAMQRKSKPNQ